MATRWMKWDETTHIFMYSTDGVTFNPLPLNAACITEGTLSPSVIPGGTGPSLSGSNIWTGSNLYSGTVPSIRFQETDAAANAKIWDVGADGALLNIKTLNDALGAPATLFSIDRVGQFKFTAVSSADHEIIANADGHCLLSFTNTSVGVNPVMGLTFRNDAGATRGYVLFTGANNSNAAFVPDALNLHSNGNGGVAITTGAAGAIALRTNLIARLSIAASGAITVNSTINAVNGYLERNRSVPIGELISIPFNAADFAAVGGTTVWTVIAANVGAWQYSISGRQVTLVYDFSSTTLTGASGSQLTVKIPAAITPSISGRAQGGWGQNPTGLNTLTFVTTGGILQIFRDATLGTSWVAGASNVRVAGVAIFYI